MGILLQAFYWDCPARENRPFDWWNAVAEKIPALRKAGFTALWLPPPGKAANIGGPSMGYDPYDYFDLGEYDQKGSVKTWFGSKDDLLALLKSARENQLQVYADLVLNHNNGADGTEKNPIDEQERWTLFNPASKRFHRNWECFHPSLFERWDNRDFGQMPDLCHRNPYVYSEMMELTRWLIEDIGFDGFRYDFVLGYGGWLVKSILERKYRKNGRNDYSPFGVGECWDNDRDIDEWLDEVNNWSDNPGSAFDFPLRDKLKSLCDDPGYALSDLAAGGTLCDERPFNAVSFVENHDQARSNPVINDKMLAYGYILTHEGYPCIFWYDYFNLGLAKAGRPDGIEALMQVHEAYARGSRRILYASENLYLMQREGLNGEPGLIFVLNNDSREWKGTEVDTGLAGQRYQALAWYSAADESRPEDKTSDSTGKADFWAPPRGYAVYVPSN